MTQLVMSEHGRRQLVLHWVRLEAKRQALEKDYARFDEALAWARRARTIAAQRACTKTVQAQFARTKEMLDNVSAGVAEAAWLLGDR